MNIHLFHFYKFTDLFIYIKHDILVWYWLKSYVQKPPLEVFYKKAVFRNFKKFTEKHLCQSLFFNKVAGLSCTTCNFIKKGTLAQVFSCEFYEIFKNTYFEEHLRLAVSVDNWSLSVNNNIIL